MDPSTDPSYFDNLPTDMSGCLYTPIEDGMFLGVTIADDDPEAASLASYDDLYYGPLDDAVTAYADGTKRKLKKTRHHLTDADKEKLKQRYHDWMAEQVIASLLALERRWIVIGPGVGL